MVHGLALGRVKQRGRGKAGLAVAFGTRANNTALSLFRYNLLRFTFATVSTRIYLGYKQ